MFINELFQKIAIAPVVAAGAQVARAVVPRVGASIGRRLAVNAAKGVGRAAIRKSSPAVASVAGRGVAKSVGGAAVRAVPTIIRPASGLASTLTNVVDVLDLVSAPFNGGASLPGLTPPKMSSMDKEAIGAVGRRLFRGVRFTSGPRGRARTVFRTRPVGQVHTPKAPPRKTPTPGAGSKAPTPGAGSKAPTPGVTAPKTPEEQIADAVTNPNIPTEPIKAPSRLGAIARDWGSQLAPFAVMPLFMGRGGSEQPDTAPVTRIPDPGSTVREREIMLGVR